MSRPLFDNVYLFSCIVYHERSLSFAINRLASTTAHINWSTHQWLNFFDESLSSQLPHSHLQFQSNANFFSLGINSILRVLILLKFLKNYLIFYSLNIFFFLLLITFTFLEIKRKKERKKIVRDIKWKYYPFYPYSTEKCTSISHAYLFIRSNYVNGKLTFVNI